MFIDTHCHLARRYYEDIDKVIKENRKRGIDRIIISGCELDEFDESILYAEQYEDVYLALGFHPSEANKIELKHLGMLDDLLHNKKVVAVGEIGLDYHYGKNDKEKQIELFDFQLSLAEKHNLPVVIHSRDATEDTIKVLKKHHVRGVIHCFSGSVETAMQYINMGFLLGIGGVVTFKNSNLPKVISLIDLSYIVLETDSPYLTPVPCRGEINSSKYIPLIAQKIAEIKEISIKEVMNQTTANAIALFDF